MAKYIFVVGGVISVSESSAEPLLALPEAYTQAKIPFNTQCLCLVCKYQFEMMLIRLYYWPRRADLFGFVKEGTPLGGGTGRRIRRLHTHR